MITASPASAIAQPMSHHVPGRRRNTRAAHNPVNTGSPARIATPCMAEVRSCPTV
jgi:hypothetical protein